MSGTQPRAGSVALRNSTAISWCALRFSGCSSNLLAVVRGCALWLNCRTRRILHRWHLAPTSKPVTLITGASSGIGMALARLFAERGHECALVARREARLNALADEIAKSGRPRPHVLVIDLTAPDAGKHVAGGLAARGIEPAIVVNNAGFG